MEAFKQGVVMPWNKLSFSVVMIIGLCILTVACLQNKTQLFIAQYSLGVCYLSEGNREKAIRALENEIQVDPKQEKIYIGLSEIYISNLDSDTVSNINNVLKRGWNNVNRERIILAYSDLSDNLIAAGKIGWAIELLEFGIGVTDDESLKAQKSVVLTYKNLELLKEIYALCESNDYTAVRKIANSYEYFAITSKINLSESIIYLNANTSSGNKVMGVGIRALGVYYGEFLNGKKNGNGIFIGISNEYLFTGNYENDLPNGYGTEELRPNESSTFRFESGLLIDGLWDKEVKLSWGNEPPFVLNYSLGILQTIEKNESGYKISDTPDLYVIEDPAMRNPSRVSLY